MQIHYRNEVRRSGVDARALKSAMRKLLVSLDRSDATISLTLVDDAAIREINRDHRGKDAPTDVLSFPLEPEPFAHEKLLGDIVISIETARRQAADYDAPLQREVERLMIHGLLARARSRSYGARRAAHDGSGRAASGRDDRHALAVR